MQPLQHWSALQEKVQETDQDDGDDDKSQVHSYANYSGNISAESKVIQMFGNSGWLLLGWFLAYFFCWNFRRLPAEKNSCPTLGTVRKSWHVENAILASKKVLDAEKHAIWQLLLPRKRCDVACTSLVDLWISDIYDHGHSHLWFLATFHDPYDEVIARHAVEDHADEALLSFNFQDFSCKCWWWCVVVDVDVAEWHGFGGILSTRISLVSLDMSNFCRAEVMEPRFDP